MVSTRNLAIYASVIATLNGAWALFIAVFKDRPRVRVKASDVTVLDKGQPRPAVEIEVINAGRRPITITTVAFDNGAKGLSIPLSFARQCPFRLEESQSKRLILDETPLLKPHKPMVRDAIGKEYPLKYRWTRNWRRITLQYWRESNKQNSSKSHSGDQEL